MIAIAPLVLLLSKNLLFGKFCRKLRSLFDGLDDRKLHPQRGRFWRFFKRTMDKGNSFIAVVIPGSKINK